MSSRRAQKYPAAAQAMRGIQVIEQMPDKQKPKVPKAMWVAYYDRFDTPYAHFDDGPTERPAPAPEEIDHCLTWAMRCQFLFAQGRDRDNWRIFLAYALGVPVPAIRDRWFPNLSRQAIENRLDKLFYEIEVQTVVDAFRG